MNGIFIPIDVFCNGLGGIVTEGCRGHEISAIIFTNVIAPTNRKAAEDWCWLVEYLI